MARIFEDEFMEQQSELISLCLELVGSRASKIYAYGSIEAKTFAFNAFFEVDGQIKTTSDVAPNMETISKFLSLGTETLETIKEVCKKYKQVAPTEIKMIYDCVSGKFQSQYKYEPICTAQTGIDCSRVFINWLNEVKQSL